MIDASLADDEPARSGEERRGLFYPWGRWVPERGAPFEVAPGVYWLRMPLPIALDHINLWVLDDGDGLTIVDTGLPTPEAKDIWRTVLAGPFGGKPVRRVIVTHYHPDHMGLAGWLTYKHGAPLLMTRGEYLLGRVLTLDTPDAPPSAVIDFYTRAGWPPEAIDRLKGEGWGRFAKVVSPLPVGFTRLQDGQTLDIGGRTWRIVTGSGHSPEHACLACDDLGLMIGGDQLLPRITSNVSVYPTEPRADPLGEWMASLDKLEALGDRYRILPAHNEPFDGLTARTRQLREHHEDKLAALEAYCDEPRTAFETFAAMFSRPVRANETMMATGEALAHLHYLEARGRVSRLCGDTQDRFVRC